MIFAKDMFSHKRMINRNFFSILFVIFIFIFDRLTKLWVLSASKNLEQFNISITSFLNLKLVWNNGVAFGLLSFNDEIIYNIITTLIFLIILYLFFLSFKSSESHEKIALNMILGGGIGNIFDRIYYSSVIDFIDINYNNFHWFIFNIADIFITCGIIMLIILEILKTKKHV